MALAARLKKSLPPFRVIIGLGCLGTAALYVIPFTKFVGMVLLQHLAFGIDDTANSELRMALAIPGMNVAVRAVGTGAIIADTNSALLLSNADIQRATMQSTTAAAEVSVMLVPAARQRIRGSLSLAADGHATFVNGHRIQQFRSRSLDGGSLLLVTKVGQRSAEELVRRLNATITNQGTGPATGRLPIR